MNKDKAKKKVCIVGHFAFGREALNGQTVKTKTITSELERQLGKDEVMKIDTSAGKKGLVKLFFQVMSDMKKVQNTVMLPAHNGIRYFTPLLYLGKKFFHSKIHYIVIGGWLPDFIKEKIFLKRLLKKFDHIYVETTNMKKRLEEQGFTNIYLMPNCKTIQIVKESNLMPLEAKPYRLCTFSRVMQEKGIEDAVQAVEAINKKYNEIIFRLDIYGEIEQGYEERFQEIRKDFPEYIQYCGNVNFDQSTSVLRNYYALLFPTHFYTEGIPGTIIDAFASGTPVIAARWENFHDMIEHGKDGFGYQFDDHTALTDTLEMLLQDPQDHSEMRRSCIKKAQKYTSEKVMKELIRNL